ncbi:hypothetical protein RhiirA5_430325 [Rhizophagus irregularis]|uniref:Uncharacterized protein n=1 Tax=Rhizophagus irregularis TaxID=588596 RepID=A0A2N0NWX7_9GLOM|nr:hypothetical protein RhiirA5_430325 [Rhizophagus irregularis]
MVIANLRGQLQSKTSELDSFKTQFSTLAKSITEQQLHSKSKEVNVLYSKISDIKNNLSSKIEELCTLESELSVPKVICENATHSCLFNGSGSTEDISRIVHQHVEDHIIATKIIKKYLREREFIVFDLTRPESDELAVRVRWDTPLDLTGES